MTKKAHKVSVGHEALTLFRNRTFPDRKKESNRKECRKKIRITNGNPESLVSLH
jgi:hypothetical protein